MFTKILLSTDFSGCSAEAAGMARSLAERLGSRGAGVPPRAGGAQRRPGTLVGRVQKFSVFSFRRPLP